MSFWEELQENVKAFCASVLDGILGIIPADWLAWILEKLPPAVEPRWIAAIILLLTFVLLTLILRSFRHKAITDSTANLRDLTRAPLRAGYIVAIGLVFGLVTWSFSARLEGAAIAPGVVSPEGYRKTVQHLEGGIIRSIHVREGDKVTKGQVLLTLDDVQARARLDELVKRYTHLLARVARLEAELDGSEILVVPISENVSDEAELIRAISDQQELLTRRITTQKGRDNILRKRIKQLDEENLGLKRTIVGLDEKTHLIEEEIQGVTSLLGKGLERKYRLLALKRAAADITIERATSKAQIARNNQKIGETELQLLAMVQQEIEDSTMELSEMKRTLAELESEIRWHSDVVDRTEIRSPIEGKVMNVRVTTLSGVVRNGEPILDIVPSKVPLIIDARVNPIDIDVVSIGMPARIHLTAYQQRNMPQIFGLMRSISADRIVDENTGHPYYLAKVEVLPAELADLQDVELVSGMPVEVMLQTGEASVADYVIGPLLSSIRRSFRENHGS